MAKVVQGINVSEVVELNKVKKMKYNLKLKNGETKNLTLNRSELMSLSNHIRWHGSNGKKEPQSTEAADGTPEKKKSDFGADGFLTPIKSLEPKDPSKRLCAPTELFIAEMRGFGYEFARPEDLKNSQILSQIPGTGTSSIAPLHYQEHFIMIGDRDEIEAKQKIAHDRRRSKANIDL